jgi:hypothetical protein
LEHHFCTLDFAPLFLWPSSELFSSIAHGFPTMDSAIRQRRNTRYGRSG